jgi:hypothetical protein
VAHDFSRAIGRLGRILKVAHGLSRASGRKVRNVLLLRGASIPPSRARPTSWRLLHRYPALFPDVMHRKSPQVVRRRRGGRSRANAVIAKCGRSQLRSSCALLDARSSSFARRGDDAGIGRAAFCLVLQAKERLHIFQRASWVAGSGKPATTTAFFDMTKTRSPLSDTFLKTRSGRGWFRGSATIRTQDQIATRSRNLPWSQG